MQEGLFGTFFLLQKIDKNGDPLVVLNEAIDWEMFRPQLESIREYEGKATSGRKPFDVILMFKILILKHLYNLSDDSVEQQILDRLSFHRFLGLTLEDRVPDSKTIWAFQNLLNENDVALTLFEQFDAFLRNNGFEAKKGQIVDASIVEVPKQRNNHSENERIKNGDAESVREEWSASKAAQKDTDARWTQKRGCNYFGYKHHDSVDVAHKFIRKYKVTTASVHDTQVFTELLTSNTSKDVYADSAYNTVAHRAELEELQMRPHLQRKNNRGHQLTSWEKQGNNTRAKLRVRIEHVFGIMKQRMRTTVIRTIGIIRARTVVGLRSLAYNLARYAILFTF